MIDPRRIRENILRCSHASGHGHIPTSFSIVELLVATYQALRHDPRNPQWPERDIFILSKGHAALGYYCVLAEFGFFDAAEVATFGRAGSRFGCHPDRLKVPGVEWSCGSLGHGIAAAVGVALAQKIRGTPRRTFVLVGDGEANEGSVWEAVMIAADQKLPNLTILYDHNRSQVRCLQISNPGERFAAFGCQVHEVNGHDLGEISAALAAPVDTRPKCIIGHTVKGHGSRTLAEDMFAWHRRSPKAGELAQLTAEIHA